LAGLKKWVPTTCWGRDVVAAISFTSSDEVFVAMMASGRQSSSSREKMSFFRSMFSKTASMTMSASDDAVEVERRLDERDARLCVLGGHASLGDGRLVVLPDGRHAAVERGLLALGHDDGNARVGEAHRDAAAHRAAAEDRTAVIVSSFVSGPTPFTLRASRSAKNAWRCAFDCSDVRSFWNVSRSNARPSSNGCVTAASTQSMHACGASKPRMRLAVSFR
jgi:hypothetical protein